MNYNIKTVANQKIVKIQKEVCNKQNLYTTINLQALESASIDLQAGAFKLWVYFAKNQDRFTFALSSKDAEQTFGIKIKQYNNAIKELEEKGYLIKQKGNEYIFSETPFVMPKGNNEVKTKSNNELLPKETRNNIDNTINNNTNTHFVF